jgi:type I restriction enzyme, S subunit
MLLIPKPDRGEQDEMCHAVDSVNAKLALHHRKHATLSALFRTLLHQLMTAQIRMHDLDLPELGSRIAA